MGSPRQPTSHRDESHSQPPPILPDSCRLHDIDILIRLKTEQTMQAVRERLKELDGHFANAGLKFFFVQRPDPEYRDDELVRRSRHNVLIETLPAGQLGLPAVPSPVLEVHTQGVPVLSPTILPLTKLKRWTHNHASTRPQTLRKARIDRDDIAFMITYLNEHAQKIEFERYQGKSRLELIRLMAVFYATLVEDGEDDVLAYLRTVMYPDDWATMTALPPVEEESRVAPVEEPNIVQT